MIKTDFKTAPEYLAPKCKLVKVASRSVLCGSRDVNGNPIITGDGVVDDSEDWGN